MPTVVKVGLDPKKQTLYRRTLNQQTGAITTSIVETWMVQWSAAQTDPSANYGASDGTNTVPVLGDLYTGLDAYPTVTDINPMLDNSSGGQVYRVQVTYSRTAASGSDSGKWDTQVSFGGIRVTEPMYFDLDSKPVVNSAHQEYTSQYNQTHYDTSLKVSFKSTTFDEESAEGIRGCVNADEVTLTISRLGYTRTFPAKTLLFEDFTASPVFSNQTTLAYWQVSLDFTYRPLITAPTNGDLSGDISTLEQLLIADQGFAYLDEGGPGLINFTVKDVPSDQGGVSLNKPCNLDGGGGDGRSLGDNPYFNAYRRNDLGDFSVVLDGIS